MDKFGRLNPHTIGEVMRSCVRRAIQEIRKQRFFFEAKAKDSFYKKGTDLVTSADFESQKIYLKILKENFPYAGIVAEEDFACACNDPDDTPYYYFTVDPLDGTKAFGRRQSHAISTMIAFVWDDVVEGVTIGDVMTEEMYHTRPGSNKVHRISDFETAEELKIDTEIPLTEQYLLFRDDVRSYSPIARRFFDPRENKLSNLFRGTQSIGGSIGFTFSCLWKGEVGGLVLEPCHHTPWDLSPLVGITKKLGFQAYTYNERGVVEPYEFRISTDTYEMKEEVIIIHKSHENALKQWIRIQNCL